MLDRACGDLCEVPCRHDDNTIGCGLLQRVGFLKAVVTPFGKLPTFPIFWETKLYQIIDL